MKAVILDFNGTMLFDTELHARAWSEIYRQLHPEDTKPLDTAVVCGPNNDAILKVMAPWLTPAQRMEWSEKKEALYRNISKSEVEPLQLVKGTEAFLRYLQENGIPYGLASASIASNIDFYFETYGLDRWFDKNQVVYDDGTYPNKGAMHLETARRLGVDIRQCLLIEDSAGSIAFAKQNGAGSIVAIGSSAPMDRLFDAGADYYVKDFSEFDCAWLQF